MKSHTRVVVIGGGIVGCSVLYHLTQAGWRDVVLIERGELTCGSTWHAAGLNHLYAESAFLTGIAKESLQLYQSLESETGQSCGVHITGGVRLARDKDGVEEFKRYLAPALALGVEAEIIGPNRVKELWPLLENDDFLAALHTPGEGYVDATMTTNALAKGARSTGGEIYRNTNVTGLTLLSCGEWRVDTNQGAIQSEYIVNCAGCWGGEISKLLGHYLPVMTMEHQYLVTEQTSLPVQLEAELPVLRDPSVPFYCRQERQALMVSGFEHEAKLNWLDAAPSDFAMELFPADLERSQSCLEQSFAMVPVLNSLGIRTIVNGPIPATPDMQGLLGPAHGYRTYFACCAIHGGFVQGGLTRYLAQWIVDGEPPIDLSSVDVRRFGDYANRDFAVSRLCAAHTMFSLPAMYPAMEPVGGREVRVDTLFRKLQDKGAVFGVDNGWEVANWFAPPGVESVDKPSFERANWFDHVATECRAVREAAGVVNLTSRSQFEITGAGAQAFLNELSANHLPGLNRQATCPFLTPSGSIEVIVDIDHYDDGYLLTAPASAELQLADWLHHQLSSQTVTIRNRTDELAILGLAGPQATHVLEKSIGIVLADAPVASLIDTTINGESLRLVRVDDLDSIAWQLHMEMPVLPRVYDALMMAGEKMGLSDFGMRALDSLRLERGLPRWGVDVCRGLSPAALGCGHLVVSDKDEFIGRDAMVEMQSLPNQQVLSLLRMNAENLPADPWGGELVEVQGRVIGTITSGAYGHTSGSSLAFAQMESPHAVAGARVDVVMLGERYRAEVMRSPKA